MRQMRDDGVRRALAVFTSAFSSYSGCRQYREDLYDAQQAVGPDAPEVPRLRMFYNHPGFVEANVDRVRDALGAAAAAATRTSRSRRTRIPVAMAKRCAYEAQLGRERRGSSPRPSASTDWAVVYQSRSGPPQVPWLEPDISRPPGELAARGVADVVVSPIGFVSDHLEVLFDLDVEAKETAESSGCRWRARHGGHASGVRRRPARADRRADDAGAERARSAASGRATTSARPTAACPGQRPSPWRGSRINISALTRRCGVKREDPVRDRHGYRQQTAGLIRRTATTLAP